MTVILLQVSVGGPWVSWC